MKDNITLKKISECLGISISTVSRALKDHPDISEKTKEKIRELASLLEYEPNAYAIQLRTNNSNLLGLVVPTVANYFYDSFISSLEEECRKNGYVLLILQSGDDPVIEIDNLRICRQNRVNGVFACITPQTSNMEPFQKISAMDIPVVFFDKVPEDGNYNKVCMADAEAAKLTAAIIIRKKRKKVLALFGNRALSITHRREYAFKKELEQNKKIKIFTEHAGNAVEASEKTYAYLTGKDKPDTIFCMSDEILTGAMKAVQQSGLKIPEEIAVISLSNGFIPQLYHPAISYAETSGNKLAKLAFKRMMACIGGDKTPAELFVDSGYVEGGSI